MSDGGKEDGDEKDIPTEKEETGEASEEPPTALTEITIADAEANEAEGEVVPVPEVAAEDEQLSPTSPLGGDTVSFLDAPDMLLSKGLSTFGRAGPDYLELSQTSLASLSLGEVFSDKETQNLIDTEWGNRNKLAEGMLSTLDIISDLHPVVSEDDAIGNEEQMARCEITAYEATERLDYYILLFDDRSTLFCKAATSKELETYLRAITEMKNENERQKASLESERVALEAATAEFNAARIAAENTMKLAEEEVKRNADTSRIQIATQQTELERAAKKVADEQMRIENERTFRVEVLRHEDECRRMEEAAWQALWEERKKNELERQKLEQEVESYRLEHAQLSREAAFGRRKLLIEEEDRKSRVMRSEIERLEEQIKNMNTRATNSGIPGIAPPRPTILQVAMNDTTRSNKKINKIQSLAAKLVDVETEGMSLAMQLYDSPGSTKTVSPPMTPRTYNNRSTSPTSTFLRSLRKKYDTPPSSPQSRRRCKNRKPTPLQDPPSPSFIDSSQYHMNLMMINEIRSLRSEVSQLRDERSSSAMSPYY
eukprot:TRINITY_DN18658_c0_g1_i1.p1 TRINITY_DN18658_c0_g1~~TRINITY_DN18658_c0_g1_i1.p1  ORF type:complete len:543 (+),score=156.51 TRINITY_DN18658_c0_g1_i1:104-1732(+)